MKKVGVIKHNRLCEIGVIKTVDMNKAKAKADEVKSPETPTRSRGASLDAPADDKKEIEATDENKEDKKSETPQVKVYYSSSVGNKANLFLCDGKNDGPVIYIKVSVRTGGLNITNAIREALKKVKGVENAKQIGMGGIMRVCIVFIH